jgi:hypothetical protein
MTVAIIGAAIAGLFATAGYRRGQPSCNPPAHRSRGAVM